MAKKEKEPTPTNMDEIVAVVPYRENFLVFTRYGKVEWEKVKDKLQYLER